MPVRKFRSADEMNKLVWRSGGQIRRLLIAIASVWAFGRRLRRPTFPPGVRKFRSIADMKKVSPFS